MTLFAADTTSENGPADGIRWAILRLEGDSAGELQAAWPEEISQQARAESVALEEMTKLYRALGATAKV